VSNEWCTSLVISFVGLFSSLDWLRSLREKLLVKHFFYQQLISGYAASSHSSAPDSEKHPLTVGLRVAASAPSAV